MMPGISISGSVMLSQEVWCHGPLEFEQQTTDADIVDGVIFGLPVGRQVRDRRRDVGRRHGGDNVIGGHKSSWRLDASDPAILCRHLLSRGRERWTRPPSSVMRFMSVSTQGLAAALRYSQVPLGTETCVTGRSAWTRVQIHWAEMLSAYS